MKLYHIISSVLSAFFGVQNNKKFKEDEYHDKTKSFQKIDYANGLYLEKGNGR